MPISPDPPSAQKISSSPGIIGNASFRAAYRHVVQQAQPLDREIGLNRVEHVGLLVEQGREAASGDNRCRPAELGLDAVREPLNHRDITPVDADPHLALGGATDDAE